MRWARPLCSRSHAGGLPSAIWAWRCSTFCPAFRLMVGIWLRLQFGPGQATSGAGARWLPGKFIGRLIFVVAVVAAIASSSSYLWTALIGLFIRRAAKAELRQLRAEGMATWMQKMADQFVRGAAGGVGSRVGSPGWGGFGVPGGFGGVPGAQWPSDASPQSNGRVHVDPIDVRVIDDA